jgi:hypothetical protein
MFEILQEIYSTTLILMNISNIYGRDLLPLFEILAIVHF